MNDSKVKEIKEKYISGTRIRLSKTMDDERPIETGEFGEVDFVDDVGTVHIDWDNGRTLGLIPDKDEFEIISVPEKINVVVVEPTKPPYVKKIYNTLRNKQEIVEGLIECIPTYFDDNVSYDFVMNEEWRINNLSANRLIYDGQDYIGGTFMVIKVDESEGDFVNMTQEEADMIIDKINSKCPMIEQVIDIRKEEEEIEI